jgi:hypothetical protein
MTASQFSVCHALLEEGKHIFGLIEKAGMLRFFSLGSIKMRNLFASNQTTSNPKQFDLGSSCLTSHELVMLILWLNIV